LNPHSLENAAQFNTIVTGISLRSTPFTIFIVSRRKKTLLKKKTITTTVSLRSTDNE
jgi:hypothetical protein